MTVGLEVLLDVSRPLREGMAVWPGDTPFRRDVAVSPGSAGAVTVSTLTLSSHAGTHVDAPLHVDARAGGVDSLPLERFVGPARVVDARGRRVLGADLVSPRLLGPDRRLLFRTDYAAAPGSRPYGPHSPHLAPELARAIAGARVPLVGVDGPSVDPFESESLEAHRLLAASGVAILENLDLSRAEPGDWWLLALPLAVPGCDAAPVRAALARLSGTREGDCISGAML
jgi:arylformamidase